MTVGYLEMAQSASSDAHNDGTDSPSVVDFTRFELNLDDLSTLRCGPSQDR